MSTIDTEICVAIASLYVDIVVGDQSSLNDGSLVDVKNKLL